MLIEMDKKLLGLFLLALVTSQQVLCNPVDAENDDGDYLQDKSDDYDEYDDELNDSKKPSTIDSRDEPYSKQNYTEQAEVGKSVVLKCLGENLDSTSVYMWYNGSELLLQGSTILKSKDRITFSIEDGSLTIKNINAYDDGFYRCRAFPKNNRFETNVELQINGPPMGISIGHNINQQPNIDDATLKYRSGEKDLRFKCNVAYGRPNVKVEWIHNGNTIEEAQGKDHDLKVEDGALLMIKTLHARHAGRYECLASNEFGTIRAAFNIDVQYAPFFTKYRTYFNTEEGSDVQVHCLYKASPAATSVKWFKAGSRIHDNDKHKITNDMHEHHERTTLHIKDVTKNDLVTYECEVENTLGKKKENVTVGLVPSPAKFLDYKYLNNVVYTDWLIRSHQQLTELQILFRNKENGWRPKSTQITNRNEVKPGEWKVQGSIELDAGEWELMARAKNTEGWSDDRFSREVQIKIPKDEPFESQKVTNSAISFSHSLVGLLVMLIIQRFA